MEIRTAGTTDTRGGMNVLVLTIRGLQPAFIGCYGNETVPTPTLDRWAAEGIVFDQHFADRPDSGSASRLWRSDGWDLRQHLREAGYWLARVGPPDGAGGWDADYASVRDPDEPLFLKPTRRALRQALEAAGAVEQALVWVDVDALLPPWHVPEEMLDEQFADEESDEADEDPLAPWPASEPLPATIASEDLRTLQRLLRTYGAAVAALDAGLEKLLGDCDKRGWGDATLRVLTSDRGFPLGEHGAVGYANAGLYEELVHLPLLARLPHRAEAGRRILPLTQPSDVAAWLAELTGHPLPGAVGSLGPVVRGEAPGVRERIIMQLEEAAGRESALRTSDWLLRVVEGSGAEPQVTLFEKPADRWEVNDLRVRHLDTADQLEQELRRG
jgi:arylsulfatase A-like enzyme